MNFEKNIEHLNENNEEICGHAVETEPVEERCSEIITSIPYGGQTETYVRIVERVSEFRANLPA